MGKFHSKRMKQQDFDQIKELIKIGVKTKAISAALHRSNSVIYTVNRSDSFETYKNVVRGWLEHSRQKQASLPKPVAAPPKDSDIHYTTDMGVLPMIVKELREINVNLD